MSDRFRCTAAQDESRSPRSKMPVAAPQMTRDQRESVAWDEVLLGRNAVEAAVAHLIAAKTALAFFDLTAEFAKLQAAYERHDATIRGAA